MQPTQKVRSIHVPLDEFATVSLAVYLKAPRSPFDTSHVRALAQAWAERHLDPSLCDNITQCLYRGGLLDVRVMRRKDARKHDPVGAPWQIEACKKATHVVVLEAFDLPYRADRPCLRALAAATCAVAQEFDGLILNCDTHRFLEADEVAPLATSPSIDMAPLLCLDPSWDPPGTRIAVRGLEAFALPPLEVREVPPGLAEVMGSVLHTVARWLVDRLPSPPLCPPARLSLPPELALSLHSGPWGVQELVVVDAREQLDFPLPAGQGAIRLRFGHDSASGQGVVRLIPPRAVRQAHPQRPSAAWMRELRGLLTQSLCLVPEHSELMEVAHRRSIARLGEMRRRFAEGLAPGESLFIKHGFGKPGEGLEFMWLEVATWVGTSIRGFLANEPVLCTELELGQLVELDDSEVFDWALHLPDGSVVGNLTSRAAKLAAPRSTIAAVETSAAS